MMDFKTLVTIIFAEKRRWHEVTNKDKETIFFIFNRYMAKHYPKQAHHFNVKGIDLASCMDIWFNFLQKEVRIPFWFWPGPAKRKDPAIKDWKFLFELYPELSMNDIYLLCELFPKECKDEIKRVQLIQEETEK